MKQLRHLSMLNPSIGKYVVRGIVAIGLLFITISSTLAQVTYYSKGAATDFTSTSSWGTNTDGTGTSPTSITNADNYIIANNSALTLPGNASVRQLTINSGSLTISANTLTVAIAGQNNSSLTLNSGGTLTVSGGTLNLNGNFVQSAGGTINQSGGEILVDGNNGGLTATSVASGTALVSFNATGPTNFNLTGGTFTVVDPHAATTASDAINFTTGVHTVAATGSHTFKFGNGVSTDAGGNAVGFQITPWASTGLLRMANLLIDANTGTNRNVNSITGTYSALVVAGNLTITTGELRHNNTGTTSTSSLYIGGNISNSGVFTNLGNLYLGNCVSASSTTVTQSASINSQTISGNGVFRNLTASPTANFTNLTINNSSTSGVTFSNANSLLSGTNTGTVSGTVTFTAGMINLSGGTFIQGISTTSAGTTSWTAGGFTNGSFKKWITTSTLSTTLPSTTVGLFPFIANGAVRNFQIGASTAPTTGGSITVSHTASSGLATVVGSDPSGSVSFNRLTNSSWTVATGDGLAGGTYLVNAASDGLFSLTSVATEPRLVQSASSGVGTHVAPTTVSSVVYANRNAISLANMANTYSMGVTSANFGGIFSVQSGAWESSSTWSTGAVPTSTDAIIVSAGHTVTVNATASVASTLVVNGTLTVSGSTLSITAATSGTGVTMGANGVVNISGGVMTVGTGSNRFSTFATGTAITSQLNVSSGSLIINGNLNIQSPSTFTQSGGTITVDGNASGVAANSVASGTAIVSIKSPNLTLTGGTLIVVDPHANTTLSRAFEYNVTTTMYNTPSGGHTIQFGDGTSTDAGGNAAGFSVNVFVGSGRMVLGNLSIAGSGSGTNRLLTLAAAAGITGNLTISGTTGELSLGGNTLHVAGNVTNDGTLTAASGGVLAFQNFLSGSTSAVTTAQTLSGAGVFRNLATSPTANFNSITINNTHASGVTFSGSTWNATPNATVSGTLTFTAGLLNTSGSTLTLGVSGTAAGTLSYAAGGFSTGSIFNRWVTTTAITVGAVGGHFPFVNASGQARHAYFGSATALATAGFVSVQYNEVAGTSAVSISDIYPVGSRSNGNWVVSTGGSLAVAAANDAQMRFRGDGLFTLSSTAPFFVVGSSSAANGTSGLGTGTTSAPEANKIGLSTANLTQTVYVGTTNSITSTSTGGPWENGTSWVGGNVPSCTDFVTIANGATVTVSSASANSGSVIINSGGTLVVNASTLTVGCSNNNAFLTNNGTLTVSGGAVVVNGNMLIANGANFTHSGGTISIDGNNGSGTIGNVSSVASGTPLFAIGTSGTSYGTGTTTLSGGTIIVVDPHIGSATATSAYAVYANLASGVNINAATAHTFQFGDGVSTAVGASTSGFVFNGFVGSGRLNFGAFTVNAGSAATRVVTQQTGTNAINGDLTITSGTLTQNALTTNIGGNISVGTGGTFLTNGTVIFTNTTGTTIAAQTTPQSVSVTGTGAISNLATSPTGNFNNITINNTSSTGVTFNALNNLSGAAGFSGASVTAAITFNGYASTSGANALLWGTSTARGTGSLTLTSGGMLPGSTYAIGTTSAQTGTTLTAGTAPSATSAGSYPFVDGTFNPRYFFVGRSATSAAAGITGVKYTDGTGTATVSIIDGVYTVTDQFNGKWDVVTFGTSPTSSSFNISISATNAFGTTPLNANARITTSSGVVGTHQAGTTLPNAQRTGLTFAQLTAQSFYIGLNSADVPFTSVASGDWNTASTWNKGTVPTSTDVVAIANGHTVTVGANASASSVVVNSGGILSVSAGTLSLTTTLTNSGTVNVSGGTIATTTSVTNNAGATITVSGAGALNVTTTLTNNGTLNANAGSVTVTGASTTGISNASGATFTVAGGTVTVGPTGGSNRTFSSSGTLVVSSGTLNVNGNLTIATSSIFTQSGGEIIVDGNAAGVAGNSVATGTNLVAITGSGTTITLSGGTLTIVDPHAGSAGTDYALWCSASTAINASVNHTLKLGNGVSTDPGNNTNGMYIYLFPGTSYLILGNVVVDNKATSARNRFVNTTSAVGILGNLTINTGGEYRVGSTTYLAGNLVNNGILTASSSALNLASFANATAAAATGTQSVSGTGIFRNSVPTAAVSAGGTGYVVGDIITVSGGTFTSQAQFVVTAVTSGAVTSVLAVSHANYSVVPTAPAATTGGTGTGCTLTTLTNFTPTANIAALTINNTNTTGITLSVPLSISGTLTMTSGIINTTSTNLLSLISGATLSGTGSATNKVVGPFARTFAASRTAAGTYDNTTLFPVGRGTTYSPVWVDPTTTAGGSITITGETFATNSGTAGGGVSALSAARWEVLSTSGFANLTSTNIRVQDASIASGQSIVQSASAGGTYNGIVGVASTYSASGPTITSSSSIQAATLTASGYLAYATLSPCVAPVNQPTSLVAANLASTSIDGSFTAAVGGASGYLVVRYATGATPSATPVTGTIYAANGALGNGTVVYVGPLTTFTSSSLTANTSYDFYVYAYNNSSCSNIAYNTTSPLMASLTTCIVAPTSNAASSIGSTSFTANWTSAAGATSYLLDVSTSNTFVSFVTGYNGLNVGNVLSQIVTGLTKFTTYYYRIRATNGTCQTSNTSTQTITTATNPPYIEDFNSVTAPALPNGTSVVNSGSGNIWQTYATTPTGYTGNVLAYQYNSSNAANTWFFTPGIELIGGTTYSLSYLYGNNSTTYVEKMKVAYGTSATAAAMTNAVADYPTINTNLATSDSKTFTPSTTGVYYFGFQAYSASNQFNLYVDDIKLLGPCATPNSPTALVPGTTGPSSLSFTFTPNATAPDGYMVVRYPAGSAVTAPTNGNSSYAVGQTLGLGTISNILAGSASSLTITGLTPSTSYDVYIYPYTISNCTGGPAFGTALNGTQSTSGCPTLSSTVTVGATGDYTTLTNFALVVNGCLTQPTMVELQSNYNPASEVFPITFNTSTGASASKQLTIRPATGAGPFTISGSSTSPIIDFNGAKYVKLDGRAGGSGSSVLSIVNTGNGAALRLINDAQNDTIQYVMLTASNTSQTNGVVVIGGAAGTSASNGNNNNVISNCNINGNATSPNGIYAVGTASPADNKSNVISNNNIYDYFNDGTGITSNAGIQIASNNAVSAGGTWTISGNSFYQTAARSYAVNTGVRAINADGGNAGSYTISNNIVGGSGANGAGSPTIYSGTAAYNFSGFRMFTSSAATTTISGNTITNISLSGNASNSLTNGMGINSGQVIISNNTIGSATTAGSISVSAATSGGFTGINTLAGTSATGTTFSITNNTIAGIALTGSNASSVLGINLSSATTLSGSATVTGNMIGTAAAPITNATNSTITGINQINASASPVTFTISGNTINNLQGTNTGTSGRVLGITASAGINIIGASGAANTITNLTTNAANTGTTSSASVIGISMTSTTAGQVIANNVIHSLSNTGSAASTVSGIYYSGPTTGTNEIKNNFVHSLSETTAAGVITAMEIADGGNSSVYNNMIRLGIDGSGAAITSGIAVNGISQTSSSSNHTVYFNSIYVGGTGVGGSANTFAFTSAATSGTRVIRNNIFANVRANGAGTGKHYAARITGATGLTINNNDYWTGASFLALNNATDVTSLAGWKTAFSQDAISLSEAPPFIAATGTSSTVDLHITSGLFTGLESSAFNITGITTDRDGDTRPGPAGSTNGGALSSDIGADEFDGKPSLPTISSVSITPNTVQCVSTSRTVTATVTPVNPLTAAPILTYTVNGTGSTNVTGVAGTGSFTTAGTWTFTIPTVTPGNGTVAWSVSATDGIFTATSTTSSYSDEPAAGASGIVSSTPASTNICIGSSASISVANYKTGNSTVGTGTVNSSSSPTPFSGTYGGMKGQYLILASELTAAGFYAGDITSLGINFASSVSTTYQGLSVEMGTTSLSSLPSTLSLIGGLTAVYGPTNLVNPTAGVNTFTLTTPFTWDGTSNIIISTSWSNNLTTSIAASVVTTTTSFNSAQVHKRDSYTPAALLALTGPQTGGSSTVGTARPNFTLTGNVSITPSAYSWSDGTSNIGSTNPINVIVNSTKTYTVTATIGGCPVSSNLTITPVSLPSAPTASGSSHCGNQKPTASVTDPNGFTTPKFRWYNASTGGTKLQDSVINTYGAIVGTTTTFYVSVVNPTTQCESPRTAVVITVTPPDSASAVTSLSSVCLNQSFTLTAANTAASPSQSYTYGWLCTTTGSGATTTVTGSSVSITPTAAGTYVYGLTATDGACVFTNSVTVTVNARPTITTVSATPATVCSGSPINLIATSVASSSGNATVGTDNASTKISTTGVPYRTGTTIGNQIRNQYLVLASDLTAAGLTIGNITGVTFVVASGGGGSMSNLTFKLANVSNTSLNSTFLTPTLTTALTLASYAPVVGNNSHTFTTPFSWDGTSNLLLEVCGTLATSGSGCTMATTSTGIVTTIGNSTTTGCTDATGSTISDGRPVMIFSGQVGSTVTSSYSWTWSPGSGVTGANATTSVANTGGSPITQAFTATATTVSTGCSSTATTAAVTINPAISANTISGAQSIITGSTPSGLTGSAPAGGDGSSYTYQWLQSTSSATSGFTNASGASTSQNYTPSALTQSTWFRRIVSSGSCNDTAAAIKIDVFPVVGNNTISTSQTICSGTAPAGLTGTAASGGNGSISYQWVSSTTNATSGFSSAAGTANGQNYNPSTLTANTWFRRVATSLSSSDTSAAVLITVNPVIAGNSVSSSQSIITGSTPSSLVGSSPTGGNGTTYTYQWQISTTSATSGYTNAGGSSTSQNYAPTSLTQTTWYRRLVNSGSCGDTSGAVEITVYPVISNNTVGTNQTICSGNSPANILGSTPNGGNSTYSYQWISSTTSANTGFAVATGVSNTKDYSPSVLSSTTWYRRVVGSLGNVDTSSAMAVIVNTLISSNTISSDQTICNNTIPGSLVGSTPSGGNGSTYTYTWLSSTTSSSAGFAVATGTSNNQNYTPSALTQSTWYKRVTSSGACANDTSAAVKVTVSPIITFNSVSGAQSIITGTVPGVLTGSTPTGGNGSSYTFQWQSSVTSSSAGYTNATGTSTAQDYAPSALSQTTWYRRIAQSGGCVDTSSAIQIGVFPTLSNNTISNNQAICNGSAPVTISGSVPLGGNSSYAYQWLSSTIGGSSGFSLASGANSSQNYSPSSLTITTWYRRVVTSAGGRDTSAAVQITVNPVLSSNTISGAQSIITGSTPASITGSLPTGGNGSYTYSWLSSTTGATTGYAVASGTNNSQNYAPSALTVTTWYRRLITSGGCSDTSGAVQVTVNPIISNNTISSSQTICSGTTPATLTGTTPTGGDGSYTYKWISSTTSGTAGFAAASGTNSNQNYVPAALTQKTWFRRIVLSSGGADTSANIVVDVNTAVVGNTLSGAQAICNGSTPTGLTGAVPTGGNGSTYSYTWLSSTTSPSAGFGIASGTANGINYTPSSLTQTTWYKRVVSSGVCSNDTSSALMITVNPNLTASVSISATATSVCGPGSITFAATPTNGGTTPAYQWRLNGVNVGTNSNTYTSATPSVDDSVYVILTSNATPCLVNTTANSNGIKLTNSTVTPTVSISVADSFICSGATTVFSATPTNGGGSPTFQWKKNGVNVGTSSNTYSDNTLVAGDSITLVLTSNASCLSTPTAVSNFIRISIRPATAITTQPVSISRCVGSAATFSVTATGDGTRTYQWRKGGSNITNANSTTYTISTPALTDSGSYTVVVTAGCGSVTSSVGYLTMTAPVSNNTASGAQSICAGSSTAQITGSAPTGGNGSTYIYLWQSSTTSSAAGFAAATGTNNTQNYQPTGVAQTTWFRRVTSSGVCAADTSGSVQISVTPALAGNTASGTQTICSGSPASAISGAAPSGGTGTYSYTWLSSTTSATAGFSVASGTTSNQNYTPTVLAQTTWFRRLVVSGSCSDTSVAVQVTVNPVLVGNTVSGNQTLCLGSPSTTLAGATPTGGTGTYLYSWLSSTTSATSGYAVASGTTNGVNYAPGSLTVTTWYRRLVTSGACSDTSAAVQVTVNPVIAGNTASGTQTICSGSTAATITGATPTGGTGTYTYSWLSSTTSATAGFAVASGTNNAVNYAPGSLTATTWYRRLVTSGACSDTSVAVQLTVNPVIAGNTVSGTQTICAGSTAASITGATPTGGTGTYTYSWLNSTTGATSGYTLASGVNNSITYSPGTRTATTWFRRLVSSGACSDTSSAYQVIVNPIIAGNSATGNQTICEGSSVASITGSTVSGGNGTYTYSWLSSTTNATTGFAVASGTNNTVNYAPGSLTATTWYRRLVTSGSCSDTSAAVQITVNPLISGNTATGAQTICSGSTASTINGAIPTGGTGTYTYSWLSSTTSATTGYAVASGTTTTANYSPGARTVTTWFRRLVTSGSCSDTSSAVQIVVTNPVANNTISGTQSICSSATPTSLTGSTPTGGNGTTYTYVWLSSTTSATSGYTVVSGTSNTVNYTPGALTQTTWFRRAVSSGACANDTSTAVQITVTPAGNWTGVISNAWNNVGNWSCPVLPLATTNVTIPSTAPNMPVITDGQQTANLTIQTGATLTLSTNNSVLSIFGNITNSGTFANTNGKVILAGSAAQTLPGGTYAKVQVNNAAGITLGGSVTLNDSLILVNGKVSLGANNLTIGNASFASLGSATSYISTNGTGNVIVLNVGSTGKTGTVNVPVGNSSFNPVVLTNTGTTDSYTVWVIDSVTNSYAGSVPTGLKLTTSAVNRTWIINEGVAGGSNATVTLQWAAADELSGFTRSASYVGRYNGTTWTTNLVASAASGSNPYTQSRSGITTFSPFGVGSNGALPVEMLSFTAAKRKESVKINWVTASEINNDHFIIQRSADGKTFEDIAMVKGSGTTNILSSYQHLDEKATTFAQSENVSTLYYRLMQVDFDNSTAYSRTVAVNMDIETDEMKVEVTPNPFTDMTNVLVKVTADSKSILRVTDVQGRVVFEKPIELEQGANTILINELAADAYSGVYFVNIITPAESIMKRIVKGK